MFKERRACEFDECWMSDPQTGCHNWLRSVDRDGYGERIQIAEYFNMSQPAISQIVRRATWHHV